MLNPDGQTETQDTLERMHYRVPCALWKEHTDAKIWPFLGLL